MNSEYVTKVCVRHFHKEPDSVERFAAGLGNYVFRVRFQEESYVFRCGEQSYMETINWLCRLKQEEIPISQVIDAGVVDGVNYMICTFLEGEELGTVYPMLSDQDKRHIANTVVDIQERAARLNIPPKRSVWEWVQHMLDRAQARIAENGYFEPANKKSSPK